MDVRHSDSGFRLITLVGILLLAAPAVGAAEIEKRNGWLSVVWGDPPADSPKPTEEPPEPAVPPPPSWLRCGVRHFSRAAGQVPTAVMGTDAFQAGLRIIKKRKSKLRCHVAREGTRVDLGT